jgi:hypothetical protein
MQYKAVKIYVDPKDWKALKKKLKPRSLSSWVREKAVEELKSPIKSK